MKKFFLSSVAALGLLSASPAFAQCYCNLYSRDGVCADQICYNDNDFYFDRYRYNQDNYESESSYSRNYYYYNSDNRRSSNEDVSVNVTTNKSNVESGDTITYTIRLRNERSGVATTDVVAELDEDVIFESASDGGDDNGDEVEWDNIRVPSRGTETLTLRVRVRGSVDDGDEIRLRVETEDDSATVTTDVEDDDNSDDFNGDIRVNLSDSPDPVYAGDTLTYRIEIRNRTNDDQELDVRAELDDDTSFLSASNGGDEDGDEVEWDSIDVDDDDSETLTLRVRVRSGVRDGDTLRLRVEVEDEEETITTRIGRGSSLSSYYDNGNTCSFYNSYLREYYLDYCDSNR